MALFWVCVAVLATAGAMSLGVVVLEWLARLVVRY